jgi:hypothetical protein
MTIARHYDESKNPNGAFIPGVPLRDLEQEEYDALSDTEKAAVDGSDIYRKTKPVTRKSEDIPKE